MIRVLVAEDMQILRDTLVALLNLEDDMQVVAQVSTGDVIVPAALAGKPEVAVVDIDLPGTDGLTAAAGLHERCPDCRVLILTALGKPGNLRRALAAHVAGFVPKDTPAAELIAAVRRVAAGERVFDQQLALKALEVPGNPLSPREVEVLGRFAAGAGAAEIAAAMFLSYGTARNYLASAVTKLGARNRVDAVRIAAEAGWLLLEAALHATHEFTPPAAGPGAVAGRWRVARFMRPGDSGVYGLADDPWLGGMRRLAPGRRERVLAAWRHVTSGARERRPAPGGRASGQGVGWASWLAIAVLCLILSARLASVLAAGAGGQVPFTVALFVLPLLYAAPRTRMVLSRHRWLVLAVQAVLTWVPFAVFGVAWQVGIGGWLAGLVLLVVPGWVSWLLAGGLLAAEVLVRAVVTGLPVSPAWIAVVTVAGYYLNDGLEFFGLVRLAQIVGETAGARERAAGLAVAGERLAAARSLQAAVGERLASIAAQATAAQHLLGRDAARARMQITAVGIAARAAVAQARQVAARHDGTDVPQAATPAAGGGVIGARLAWTVLVVVVSEFAVDDIASIIYFRYRAGLTALTIGIAVLATALQLYHSGAARQGRRPRAWPVTLGLLAVLAYAFVFPFIRVYIGSMGLLVAGSVLLLVPGRWRWAGFAAVVASYSVLYAVLLPPAANAGTRLVPNILYVAALTAAVGLVLYGLAWLAGLAAQLEALNGQLAQMAVVQERLRIARDVHDLLGLGLSAIALKSDLITRLIGRDDPRAVAEIGELGRICASARAEIRRVTGAGQRLSLSAEVSAARQILASAGVEVRADIAAEALSEAADDVLGPVLREAVTNILRHSAAKNCTIQATRGDGLLRLSISNDGVTGSPTAARSGGADPGGSGLANLTARLQAAGGRLASGYTDGQFRLTAELPASGAVGAAEYAADTALRA